MHSTAVTLADAKVELFVFILVDATNLVVVVTGVVVDVDVAQGCMSILNNLNFTTF